MSEGGRGESTVVALMAGCVIQCRVRFLSVLLTQASMTALGVVFEKSWLGFLIGSSGL